MLTYQTCPEYQLDLNCSKVDQKYEENQTQGGKNVVNWIVTSWERQHGRSKCGYSQHLVPRAMSPLHSRHSSGTVEQ